MSKVFSTSMITKKLYLEVMFAEAKMQGSHVCPVPFLYSGWKDSYMKAGKKGIKLLAFLFEGVFFVCFLNTEKI